MIPGMMAASAMRDGEPVPGGDPHWANVVSLLHFDGEDGSTTFTDEKGKVWTPIGATQLDTAQVKFGSASASFSGSYLDASASADFAFLTGDFTVEMFYRSTQFGGGGGPTLMDTRFGSYGAEVVIYNPNMTNDLIFHSGGTRAVATGLSNAVWIHIALSRMSGVTRFFVDGVQHGLDFPDARSYDGQVVRLGANYTGASSLTGHIDEFRITKGVARYTSNFTPPTAPFPNGP